MSWRIAGTFADGRCVQHALAEEEEKASDSARLACGESYDDGRFFFVARVADAAAALAANGASEISCAGCRRALGGFLRTAG